ncbi:septal ring lytic transglycosylase RlpA family protein [Massilia sp. DWR3-1-1]|uniref:septal ring lytic transglycosylase RlpA family protein n=1 Tax=Massilia sp. DWR3-1-1 TaxID=2804559 RepID=UPI003CEE38D0
MRRPLARAVAVLVALALAGCASDGHVRMSPFPAPNAPVAKHGKLDPRLPAMPAAGSGRGGYYLDDGPGENPPPGLYDVPDPIVKSEVLSRYGNKPYVVFGKTYTPLGGDSSFVQRGVASWYGKKFHGQRTSSGELYDMYLMSAAHPTLPIPSFARVTSVETGKSVVVRVNDRGPFHSSRVIDVSYTAALKLGLLGKGSHEVEIERLRPEDSARSASARRNAPAPVALATMPTIAQADATLVSSAVSAQSAEVLAVMGGDPAALARGSAAPVASDGFYLQLGAFSQLANATEARARVLATGIVELVEIVQAGSLHRLFGGPFASRDDALKAAAALPAGLAVKALVVKRSGAAAVQ